jgi:hypothetical protein
MRWWKMPWWNALSRFTLRARSVRWHEPTTAGALLTCLAVVLNVGPFGGSSQRDAALATTEQFFAPALSDRSQAGAGTRSVGSPSGVVAPDVSARFRPVTELSSILDNAFARMVFQPVSPKDTDPEIPADTTRQDRETSGAATRPLAPIVGVWAPDSGACSARQFREGVLPTIISTDGAWAGETFCAFRKQKQTETGWKVLASCSNPRGQWKTEVRLTVSDNRLKWTSKRGTQVYSRCATGFQMAAAR